MTGRTFYALCAVGLALVFFTGCASSPESHRDSSIEGTVRYLVEQYELRNTENFLDRVSRDFLGGYSEFEADVRGDLSRIDQVDITYFLDSVDYQGEVVRVGLRWKKRYLERSDRDFDGMPDIWERGNGLDEEDPSDAFSDADGDGASNLDEYRGGSDPLDAGSLPAGSVNSLPASVRREVPGYSFLVFVHEGGEYFLTAQEEDILFGNSDRQKERF